MSLKQSSLSYSFCKQVTRKTEKTTNLTTPGPGAYTATSYNNFKTKAPQWKMGTSKRKAWDIRENPGPGKYEAIKVTLTTLQNAPRYTFRLKNSKETDVSKFNCSPGPCNYNPDWKTTLSSFSAFTMGLKTNPTDPANFVPGVGHYKLRKESGDFEVPSYK